MRSPVPTPKKPAPAPARRPATKPKAPVSKDRAVLEILGQIFQSIEELGSNIEILIHRVDQVGLDVSNMDSRVRNTEKAVAEITVVNERGAVMITKLEDILKRLG